ncbi:MULTISPECIES: ABC-ATPase domain-containing protein [Brevibacterium]|uniref:Predicted ATPase of the ABC class n=1 Tax=Brevibacterium antiquum CNRZ 918 TaxID=1255637 RepID=A0A2H1IGK3_9MICO|nr:MULTISPECIES: ABC-ATPase domain-containing protein [Brevibacterium]SMX74122.1 Predicted ATPase of the ABC class [Brevibacterium antiquum CNRZ 918]HCG56550.1 ATPase [Brevibacterium sp.]
MNSQRSNLASTLHSLDGRSYGNYKQIRGSYEFGPVTVFIDRVQVDPFASPSKVRIRINRAEAGFPTDITTERTDRIAASDFLFRVGDSFLHRNDRRAIILGRPGQEVLERTNVVIDDEGLEARLLVNLPARGRRILGHQAADILTRDVPELAQAMFVHSNLSGDDLREHVQLHRDQLELRNRLGEEGLLAFIGNGAILPRRSGDSDLPMDSSAVAFSSPASLEHTVTLSSGRSLTGMAIPRGVTVIVGGGYHGKSTILRALERGVYPHIAGDGREWVITEPSATSIRAEDGRAVTGDDISPFINNLPSGTDTRAFTSTNASGSTSQAANLVEAVEVGARSLLIDEDTSATNFMIRDDRMRALIPADREPITPFVDRIRPLFTRRGVSTVLVAGGSSAFFEVADHVIALDAYVPQEVTETAHELVGVSAADLTGSVEPDSAEVGDDSDVSAPRNPAEAAAETAGEVFTTPQPRIPTAKALRPSSKTKSAKAKGLGQVQFGKAFIDLSAVSQIVDPQQTTGIAEALEYMSEIFDDRVSLTEALAEVEDMLDAQGVDGLTGNRDHPGHVARPRPQEIAAALNRFRGLHLVD